MPEKTDSRESIGRCALPPPGWCSRWIHREAHGSEAAPAEHPAGLREKIPAGTLGPVSLEKARKAAQNLVDVAFKYVDPITGERCRPHFEIPANYERDDDLLVERALDELEARRARDEDPKRPSLVFDPDADLWSVVVEGLELARLDLPKLRAEFLHRERFQRCGTLGGFFCYGVGKSEDCTIVAKMNLDREAKARPRPEKPATAHGDPDGPLTTECGACFGCSLSPYPRQARAHVYWGKNHFTCVDRATLLRAMRTP